MSLKSLLWLILLTSCMHGTSVNLKKINMTAYPKKIIWIQIAGLDDEHIAQLSLKEGDIRKNAYELFTCQGDNWEYDLNELYPEPSRVMHSLITGSANINGTCDDFKRTPFWDYFSSPVKTIIVEKQATEEQSLVRTQNCQEAGEAWKYNYLIKLDNLPMKKIVPQKFNILQREPFKKEGVYADSACDNEKCNNTLISTLSFLTNELVKGEKNYVLLVRDFSLMNSFKNKKFSQWEKINNEWNQAIATIQNSLLTEDTLLLVSGVAPIPVQYPEAGEPMKKWLLNQAPLPTYPRSLFGKTWAMGARAQNFCGTYHAKDFVERIFWQEKEKSFFSW